ncbi:MAG: hypothetical protein ACRD2L_21280, partial [Terriglobia bacterium]
MAAKDHHRALKSETVAKLNASGVEIVLAVLQWGRNDRAFTLHVNPTSYSSAGLQATDWLTYLGFQRNDRCSFTAFQRCFSREVPEGFDLQRFVAAYSGGFERLGQAEGNLQACGFLLSQPEGWGFYFDKNSGANRPGYAGISGDGHTAMKTDTMKKTKDERFMFCFSFIDTGRDKAFVTHYRPKHPPLSTELRSVFGYLGLQEFENCPEFEFEPCFFRTLQFEPRDDNPFGGNIAHAHRCFDAHEKQFSPGIENLLAANSEAEA